MSSESVLTHLGKTFGKIPDEIYEQVKYLTYDDDYFICVPCDKIIRKVENNKNNAMTINFQSHFSSGAHRSITVSKDVLWKRLCQTFAGNVPRIVRTNFNNLGAHGKNFKCEICSVIIITGSTIMMTLNNFTKHLTSKSHEENLCKSGDVLSQLYDIYGGIPQFVMNHCQFLKVNCQNYICYLCNKHLMVHRSDLDETENNFEKHLHSLEHMRRAKQTKLFSIIPELNKIFSNLPNYMLRNRDYISINGSNFFCILCNENIKNNREDYQETEHNLKLHISSSAHEEQLNNRRDSSNSTFNKLHDIFDSFSDCVFENLKYLELSEDDFYCGICKETIVDDEEAQGNIESHFKSESHENNVDDDRSRLSQVAEDLEGVFGGLNELIKDNIQHIVFNIGNDFECVLCNKIMKSENNGDYETNTSVTIKNFEQHLTSTVHEELLESENSVYDDVKTHLEELFNDNIPLYIFNNMMYLDCAGDNFHCHLCDVNITISNKRRRNDFSPMLNKCPGLTEENFRFHLLSAGHMNKLKFRANQTMIATEQLEFIFSKTPNFVLNNIEHLERAENDNFICSLCDAEIVVGSWSDITIKNFKQHLCGNRHKTKVKEIEDDNHWALDKFDKKFWRIPEVILRNIDFLCTYSNDSDNDDVNNDNDDDSNDTYDYYSGHDDNGDTNDNDDDDKCDFFCFLCQQVLPVSYDDTLYTVNSFRDHLYSQNHQSILKNE